MRFSFEKYPQPEKLKFFQSSLPYLHNNALVKYSSGKTKRWSPDEPHPTNRSFLTFTNGHYGIYFSLFNHELRKREHQPSPDDSHGVLILLPSLPSNDFLPEFYISKVKKSVQIELDSLKSISEIFLSTTSLIRPRYSLRQICQTRNFSHSTLRTRDKPKTAFVSSSGLHPENCNEKPTQASTSSNSPAHSGHESDSFEDSLVSTQVNNINGIFENHSSPAELNAIYPIYQSLKRNDFLMPSIDDYNVVLKSITMRALDSELTLAATESRLTTLLTVYQDILRACIANPKCQPNLETYNTVLQHIFSSIKSILSSETTKSQQKRSALMSKVKEFYQVGINLYISLLSNVHLTSEIYISDVLYCSTFFPSTVDKNIGAALYNTRNMQVDNVQFYTSLLDLTQTFKSSHVLNLDKRQCYEFISETFENFKKQCSASFELRAGEFQIYSSLLRSLIATDNLPIGSKFLDEIISDFKNNCVNGNLSEENVIQVSSLISEFLQAIMDRNSPHDIDRAFSLLMQMRKSAILPDVNVATFDKMINSYIGSYVHLESSKTSSDNVMDINVAQAKIYTRIWDLFNYVAIRQDFDPNSMNISSHENLLSLCLDLGDSENTNKLIKEFLIRKLAFNDSNILRKTLSYLSSEAANNNGIYHDIIWALAEQHASTLFEHTEDLNEFLSEHIYFLLSEGSLSVSRILNSIMIARAFESFRLQSSNIYGLVKIMAVLQKEALNGQLSSSDLSKVLQYQSFLINEYEDTDNHYLEIPAELADFGTELQTSFKNLLNSDLENVSIDTNVIRACDKLNLTYPGGRRMNIAIAKYDLNLLPYFNISLHEGLEQFLTYFALGYNFNFATWRLVLNRTFIVDCLETEERLSVRDLIDRIFSRSAFNENISLLCDLVSLESDRVNIKIVRSILERDQVLLLRSSRLLNSLSEHALKSQNQYYLNQFVKSFEFIAKVNSNKRWKKNIFQTLSERGMHSDIERIAFQNFDLFIAQLDVSIREDEEFLTSIMTALIQNGSHERIQEIFEYHFGGQDGNKLLVASDKLLACLINYYISVGHFEIVLSKFKSVASRSDELHNLVMFARYFAHLTNRSELALREENLIVRSLKTLAIAILNESSVQGMNKLYYKHRKLVKNPEEMFNLMIQYLTKSANLSDKRFEGKIFTKFQQLVKFCKFMNISTISLDTLRSIIQFLTISKSAEILNILFRKFFINRRLVFSFNFYFLKVELKSAAEASSLLNLFEQAFKTVEDRINLNSLEHFKSVNGQEHTL